MDTVTHALLGVTVGQAAFRNRLGRGTLLTAAVASALPDFDIVATHFGDAFQRLAWHRAESHSLILTALAAPLLGWLAARIFAHGKQLLLWSALVLTGLWLHILLDLFTSWGTESLSPFDKSRYAWDALPIIDPLFSGPLFLASILAAFGARRAWRKPARIAALVALGWCAAYTAFGCYNNQQARQIARTVLPPQMEILRATPAFGTTFLWNVIARDKTGNYTTVTVSTWKGATVSQAAVYPISADPRVKQAENSPTGRLLQRTSGGYQYFTPRADGSLSVLDLRYPVFRDAPVQPAAAGESPAPSSNFRYRVEFSSVDATPVFHPEAIPLVRRDRLGELSVIWRLAFLPPPGKS